jgi:hypothetical protein
MRVVGRNNLAVSGYFFFFFFFFLMFFAATAGIRVSAPEEVVHSPFRWVHLCMDTFIKSQQN